MSRVRQAIQLQYLYMKPGFTVFWGIILAIIVFQYLVVFYFTPQGADVASQTKSVVGGHLLAVVIFMGVATGIQCWETMPYSLNLGSTRREFWLGCAVFNFFHSLVMSAILVGLSLVERAVFIILGFEHNFMYMATTIDVWIVLTLFVVNFAVIAAAAAGVFLTVFIAYRYGWKSLMVLGASFLSGLMLFPAFRRAVMKGFEYVFLIAFGNGNPWEVVGWLVILSLVCYLLAFPLVKGSQVKN